MRRLQSDETGSILPLSFFYVALSLIIVLIVTAATSLYLERKRLFTLADGAALAGAEAYSLDTVSTLGGDLRAELTDSGVRDAATDYLASAPNTLEDLTLERAGSPDGRSASVGLSSYWRPPMLTLLIPEGMRIEVDVNARSVLR